MNLYIQLHKYAKWMERRSCLKVNFILYELVYMYLLYAILISLYAVVCPTNVIKTLVIFSPPQLLNNNQYMYYVHTQTAMQINS